MSKKKTNECNCYKNQAAEGWNQRKQQLQTGEDAGTWRLVEGRANGIPVKRRAIYRKKKSN